MRRSAFFTPQLSSTLFLACLIAPALPSHAAFELAGQLPPALSAPGATVTVLRESLEERATTPVASSPVTDGRFRLQVDAGAGLFNVQIGEAKASFVAANGQALTLSVSDDGSTLAITGEPDQALYADYETFRAASLAKHVTAVRNASRTARAAGNAAEVDRLIEEEVAATLTHRRELNDFTITRLAGSATLYAASLRWDADHRLDELAALVSDYSAKHTGTEIARLMEERIARFRATAIGALAPELTGPTPEGGTLKLSDLRGRYVLVDFWASWCAPCRIQNRVYVELYANHKSANFEILAVSVDQNAAAWNAGIVKDKATWLHISDVTGWKSPLAAAYNVSTIPASFLVGPDGRIIAKDARGDQLTALLASKLKP
jgi:thiol-disulfide isomerase/thioredoxin